MSASVLPTPAINKESILSYLHQGYVLLAAAGPTRDVLDAAHAIIGAPHVLTDGVWAWTADVAYYVDKYNLKLPVSFSEHMRANQWKVPPILHPEALRLAY